MQSETLVSERLQLPGKVVHECQDDVATPSTRAEGESPTSAPSPQGATVVTKPGETTSNILTPGSILWTLFILPIALPSSFCLAPFGLWSVHLNFAVIPWYLQYLWHVALMWHHFGLLYALEIMGWITNLFIPYLEKNRDEALYPLFPGQPKPGNIGREGETLACLERLSVEEFDRLGVEGFKRKYGIPCRPVLLKGFGFAKGNYKDWSLDKFVEEFSDVSLYAYHRYDSVNIVRTTFGKLAQEVKAKGPIYARAVEDIFKAKPSLRDDPPVHLFKDMRRNFLPVWLQKSQFQMMFFSSEGTRTQIHFDVTTNFNTCFEGAKLWWLFDPRMMMLMYPFNKGTNQYGQTSFDLGNIDHEKFPAVKYAQGYKFVQEAGDTLWLPTWVMHGIFNLKTPTCMAFFNGFGTPQDCFSQNASGTLAFYATPRNWLDALDLSKSKRRWFL